MTLYSFGCSITYGVGLPDTIYPKVDHKSKYAWPEVLGEKLDVKTHNISRISASNKWIWTNVLSRQYSHDDYVVILWTYINRWGIFTNNGKYKSLNDNYDDRTSRAYYKFIHDEYDQVLMTKLMIQSTVSYLQNFDVKQLHIFVDPTMKNLHDRLTDIDYTGIIENNPNELDYHPGVDAQKEIARLVYERLQNGS